MSAIGNENNMLPDRHLGDVVERDDKVNIILAQPLGLARGYVRLVPHHSSWERFFRIEANMIANALGDELVATEHIGSTSIPHIMAKPIIDLLAGVRSIKDEALFVKLLGGIGYQFAGNDIVPGTLMFSLGVARTHLLHLTEYGNVSWDECIRFRDILRARSEVAIKYEQLKKSLSERFKSDRSRYTEEKGKFVVETLRYYR